LVSRQALKIQSPLGIQLNSKFSVDTTQFVPALAFIGYFIRGEK
jgi:hypothetical protein